MIALLLLVMQAPPELREVAQGMRSARGLCQPEFLELAVEHQRHALAAFERYFATRPRPTPPDPWDELLPCLDKSPAGVPDPEGVELVRYFREVG